MRNCEDWKMNETPVRNPQPNMVDVGQEYFVDILAQNRIQDNIGKRRTV